MITHPLFKRLYPCFLLVLLPFASLAFAEEEFKPEERYKHYSEADVSTGDKALNFGLVYTAQWISYAATQSEIIEDHGSFKNWRENIFKPHFDKDHLNYNLSKHTLVGQYYYLFYRARGYGKQSAFQWAFLSSLAFEFTIESLTERPSYQDMYQTPVLGSIVGMGAEKLSLYLHSLQTTPTTILGYLFNPMTLLPKNYSHYRIAWVPMRNQNHAGLGLQMGVAL
ncbi:MAG: DUF3943 domain-containing protein [Proteobacteria bacterium]|nr:MAG: DUF3943 domain-containing protein [Pseudomonadota bacterium]